MTRILAILLLTACTAEPPVMTDEPGTRPWGHIEYCNRPDLSPEDRELFCDD